MIIKYNLSCFVGKVILNYASFDGNNFIAVKWEDKSKCSAGHYHCGKESEVQPEQELETPVTYTPCISCSQKHMGVWEGFILRNLCAGCMGVCGLAVWALVMWTPFTPLSISLFLLVSFSLSPPPPLTFDFVCLVQRSTGSDVTVQICPINTILSNVVSAEPSFLLFV